GRPARRARRGPPRRQCPAPATGPQGAERGRRGRAGHHRFGNRPGGRGAPHPPLPPPHLHAAVLAQAAQPPTARGEASGASRESLLADLVNLQARNDRMAQTITVLERRLSEALGEAAWKVSGLGAPLDMEALHQRIRDLEQDNITLRERL